MKRIILTLSALTMMLTAIAGGIVHNTNQSASFIRMPARDASLGIDAVYYNPAGLFKLNDGIHLSLSNQYITQMRNIKSDFPYLNQKEFEGGVVAPAFPSFYMAYKKNRFAVSFGFNPIGGGGSAKFDEGLPSFEMQPSLIPVQLSAANIPTSQYSLAAQFEGSSIMYGFQGGVSFKLMDEIQLFAGARYVTVSNNYTGSLRDIQINPNLTGVIPALSGKYSGSMVPATTFFADLSGYFTGVSTTLQSTGQNLQPILNNGFGGLPVSQGTAIGLSPQEVATIQGSITALGGDPSNMTFEQAQAFFFGQSAGFAANAAQMDANSKATTDKALDASQSGSGITPIIGANFQLADNFNIGVKYEFKTELNVKNSTKIDDVGMYPNGAEVPSDLPAMLSVGFQYAPAKWVSIHAGLHQYFDRKVKYGKMIDGEYVTNDPLMSKDFIESAVGLEFTITPRFIFSTGYLRTNSSTKDIYHTDLSHSLSTHSVGGGFRFNFNQSIGLNLGFMNTWYEAADREFYVPFLYTETYNRTANVIAIGLDVSL